MEKASNSKYALIIVFLIFALLTLVLIRTLAGPEDSWIKDQSGKWIKHGNPASPMPSDSYKPPIMYIIAPLIILACFFIPIIWRKVKRIELNWRSSLKAYVLTYVLGTVISLVLTLAFT
jgi:hypothetical protein